MMLDVVGFAGAALLLLAYFMATTKHWATHSLRYQLSNLAAAIMLISYNFSKLAYVNIAINAVWASVALVGLIFMSEHQRRERRQVANGYTKKSVWRRMLDKLVLGDR